MDIETNNFDPILPEYKKLAKMLKNDYYTPLIQAKLKLNGAVIGQ